MVIRRRRKWEARWYDNRKQRYKFFDNEQDAINCENENKAKNKERKKKEKESKTDKQKRAENLLRSGHNSECESKAICKLKELLENNWNIKLIRDGAHNDIGIQRKNSFPNNLYYGIQVKSTSKQVAYGTAKTPRAKFGHINHYPNSLLICICLQPLKIWFFHGKDLLKNKPTLHECQKPYFKNALCYDEKENINNLEAFLTNYLEKYETYKLDYYNLQIDTPKFLEDYANRLYKTHKNLPNESVIREFNEIENSCVDYIDANNSRIQEKVCFVIKNSTGFYVNFTKNNGKNLKSKCTKGPYNENDFDILRVYLLCKVDDLDNVSFKRERYNIEYNGKDYDLAINHIKSYKLFGYYDIPMHKLISENYVSTENQEGKQGLMVFLPEEVAKKYHELPKRIQKDTPIWTREYFHKVY
uniref:Uncharacterized protein n=1 Tax=viral metagenome TaxID=1070528 RepID=A0A6C0AGV1_9ZZZZ